MRPPHTNSGGTSESADETTDPGRGEELSQDGHTIALGPSPRILVPVASERDAEITCAALERYFDPGTALHFVHVIEKGGGAPDKAPIEARREQAQAIFALVSSSLEDAGFEIECEVRYGTDVVEEIGHAAGETDAAAIAFVPREGSRLTKLLTGRKTSKLVDSDRLPVIVLPHPDR